MPQTSFPPAPFLMFLCTVSVGCCQSNAWSPCGNITYWNDLYLFFFSPSQMNPVSSVLSVGVFVDAFFFQLCFRIIQGEKPLCRPDVGVVLNCSWHLKQTYCWCVLDNVFQAWTSTQWKFFFSLINLCFLLRTILRKILKRRRRSTKVVPKVRGEPPRLLCCECSVADVLFDVCVFVKWEFHFEVRNHVLNEVEFWRYNYE